jgi:outer membrane protein assembly factor BamB
MRKCLLALLVAVLMAGCTWSQFHGNAARTGFQPVESKIGASTVASMSEAWTALLPNASSPVVAGGRVYVGVTHTNNRGAVDVFDAAGQTNCSGTPKVCGRLFSFATSDGIASTPAVENGVVYAVGVVGVLYAFDASGGCTGAGCFPLLWTADALEVGSGGSPAVSGGVVYVGKAAFDAAGTTNCTSTPPKRCEPLWTVNTEGGLFTSVAVAGGVAYTTSEDGTLYASDAAGQMKCGGTPKVCDPLWTAAAGGTPVAGDGRVYTMDDSRLLRVFDAAGQTNCAGSPKVCTPLWTAQVPPSPGGSTFDVPAVAYGRVYLGSAVYDASGVTNCSGTPTVCDPLWLVSEGGHLPVVANGLEFAGGADPSASGSPLPLNAFDANGSSQCSGTPRVCAPLWTVDPGGQVVGSPAILNGVLYVTTRSDPFGLISTLHAFAPA